jgi:hypothetical protein
MQGFRTAVVLPCVDDPIPVVFAEVPGRFPSMTGDDVDQGQELFS